MHYDALMVQNDEALAQAIGSRVREHRQARGWTLEQLVEHAGISRRMLINVEQASANPSISTLLKLSEALGVGLPALVEPPAPEVKHTPAGEAPVLWRGEQGGEGILAAHTRAPGVVELWDWHLQPGERHSSTAHSTGTKELLHVLAGALRIEVGEHAYDLAAGDSLSFPGDAPHTYSNQGEQPTRFALTVYEPAATLQPKEMHS